MKFIKKVANFIKECAVAAKNKVVKFFKGLKDHTEGAVILVLASIGVNALASQLPFMYTLPLWVEATMVIPVLSVLTILIMVKVMEWRAKRRQARTMANPPEPEFSEPQLAMA